MNGFRCSQNIYTMLSFFDILPVERFLLLVFQRSMKFGSDFFLRVNIFSISFIVISQKILHQEGSVLLACNVGLGQKLPLDTNVLVYVIYFLFR